jgi:hypothetical protein
MKRKIISIDFYQWLLIACVVSFIFIMAGMTYIGLGCDKGTLPKNICEQNDTQLGQDNWNDSWNSPLILLYYHALR